MKRKEDKDKQLTYKESQEISKIIDRAYRDALLYIKKSLEKEKNIELQYNIFL